MKCDEAEDLFHDAEFSLDLDKRRDARLRIIAALTAAPAAPRVDVRKVWMTMWKDDVGAMLDDPPQCLRWVRKMGAEELADALRFAGVEVVDG